MTTEEFSNEFDVLLNSYSTTAQFDRRENPYTIELDEYEKSIYLTKAQEEVVLQIYNGNNSSGNSFEKTEEARRYLNDLIKTFSTTDKKEGYIGLSSKSVFFELPIDLWFITYESVNLEDATLGCMNGNNVITVPVTQDEYNSIRANPFRGANKGRALRLDLSDKIVEVISDYNISKYLVRYLSKPEPIILTDLPDNLSINEISIKTECKLNPVIHRVILEKAVQLALISKLPGQVNKNNV